MLSLSLARSLARSNISLFAFRVSLEKMLSSDICFGRLSYLKMLTSDSFPSVCCYYYFISFDYPRPNRKKRHEICVFFGFDCFLCWLCICLLVPTKMVLAELWEGGEG